MNERVVDMTGKRYGSLTALFAVGSCASGDKKWRFSCDCGLEFDANGYYARSGKITTCQTCSASRVRKASIVHGKTSTSEYVIWTDMKSRCYNKNRSAYKDYGGRGIRVCDRWLESFENFIEDMGPRPGVNHSVDRSDNNGHYEPSNCRWATVAEQSVNKRNTKIVEIDGVKKPLSVWAKESGISLATLHMRLKSGIQGRALMGPSKRLGSITFDGITDTFDGWSRRTGIKPSTIAMRIHRYGWSIEKSLTKGAQL